MARATQKGGTAAIGCHVQLTTALLVSIMSAQQAQVANGRVGFCLDQVPPGLAGTGYTATSALTKAQCPSDSWCPLLNETKVFSYTDDTSGSTTQVEYYWWSACCTGRQGRSLIADEVSGLPTCRSNQSALTCERMQWQEKFEADFLGDDYNINVAPARTVTDPRIYGGVASDQIQCTCKASDPECEQPGSGDNCLVCRTDSPCGAKTNVQLSVSFFKITMVDLLTSQMDASVWIRQIWKDPRLAFDYQCYGGCASRCPTPIYSFWLGFSYTMSVLVMILRRPCPCRLDSFEVQASPGDMELSRIWTPDVELYNHKTPIWGDSVPRLAIVYSCWDGAPSRGGCGEVFFSRPGVITALCKYRGLIMFPRDHLSCELEFSSWALDGRHQDLVKRKKDGGVNWAGSGKGLAGLTAGATFQDYTIRSLEVTRKVSFYDCCPNSPFPTLLYSIQFKRAESYYSFKLVVPSIALAMLSFIPFYMNPETGERLGFGITMILAMLALDITAASMMPVCSEKTFMDFLSGVCMLFGGISMLETGIVMFLYHQQADDWTDALSRRSFHQLGWDAVLTVGGKCTCFIFNVMPNTLLVHGIGVDGWDGTATGRGAYENEKAMNAIFSQFGYVMRVGIKHEIGISGNLSWALVTMGRPSTVVKILRIAESKGIMTGSTRLEVSRYHPDREDSTDTMRRMFEGGSTAAEEEHMHESQVVMLDGSDNLKLRHQIYSQIFFVLDSDFSGALDVDEIELFGEYELGLEVSQSVVTCFPRCGGIPILTKAHSAVGSQPCHRIFHQVRHQQEHEARSGRVCTVL
jgi:hypothetical protein